MDKQKVTIIGGGPAAMMLAASLNKQLFDINVYEKNKALGRKFLVAGDGGFNLTHSENKQQFVNRYTPSSFFEKIIDDFSNEDFIVWLKEIGIETYVGSSKRIFPVKGIKPIDVLNAILKRLELNDVKIHYQHEWIGADSDHNKFKTPNETVNVKSNIVVFALGGSSWKVTGSDGEWTNYFVKKGIEIIPFQPSNCAYKINWNEGFIHKNQGRALKNVAITCGNEVKLGEIVLTQFGIEGSGIYGLSPQIRKQLNTNGEAKINIDLKPSLSLQQLLQKISGLPKKTWTNHLIEQLNLTSAQLDLLKMNTSKEEFVNPKIVAQKIKSIPITILGFGNIDEAISTVGGISLDEINPNFELKKLPKHYAIGEMLDWDAPTGGYLLQACFSMGKMLAKHLNDC